MKSMKKELLSVTVPSELKKRLVDLAKKEQRNVSNMTAVLLEEAIKNKAA